MSSFCLDVRVLRSFVCVVETGSITATANRLGRTQPAITLQMKRLEEALGRSLFREDCRRPVLTDEGDVVLSYAKSILKMHDELLARLSSQDVEEHVTLGVSDLYASCLLPAILANFQQVFPRIKVNLRCGPTVSLLGLLAKAEVDIALTSRIAEMTDGQMVRQEQLIWIMSDRFDIHRANPVPLALLPPGDTYRDCAIEGLERAGRKWKVACVSESVGGLHAAVFAGMAITVLCRSAISEGMRQVGIKEYFPPLPKVDLMLYRAPGAVSSAALALHEYLSHHLGLRMGAELEPQIASHEQRPPHPPARRVQDEPPRTSEAPNERPDLQRREKTSLTLPGTAAPGSP